VAVPDEQGSSINAEAAQERLHQNEDSDSDGDFHDTGVWRLMRANRKRQSCLSCDPVHHQVFLREQVYGARCNELGVRPNSGVIKMFKKTVSVGDCMCRAREMNLTNHLLGDRGVSAVLPMLTFALNLRSLCLTGNSIRRHATRQICAILESSGVLGSLVVLELSNNPLGEACAEELVTLLRNRPSLLLLGTHEAQMPAARRQSLIKASVNNFCQADAVDKFDAYRIAKTCGWFVDLELLAWVKPHAPEEKPRDEPTSAATREPSKEQPQPRPPSELGALARPTPRVRRNVPVPKNQDAALPDIANKPTASRAT